MSRKYSWKNKLNIQGSASWKSKCNLNWCLRQRQCKRIRIWPAQLKWKTRKSPCRKEHYRTLKQRCSGLSNRTRNLTWHRQSNRTRWSKTCKFRSRKCRIWQLTFKPRMNTWREERLICKKCLQQSKKPGEASITYKKSSNQQKSKQKEALTFLHQSRVQKR